MAYHNYSLSALSQLLKNLNNGIGLFAVKRSGRFISKNYGRVIHKGSCNQNPVIFTA